MCRAVAAAVAAGDPVLSLSQPLDLVDHARGCQRLFLIDAAAGEGTPGTIVRLRWPDPRIEASASVASSHGLGLPEALRLAESLGCLPPEVVVFAMYFERIRGTLRLSQRVAAALPELARRILADVGGLTIWIRREGIAHGRIGPSEPAARQRLSSRDFRRRPASDRSRFARSQFRQRLRQSSAR